MRVHSYSKTVAYELTTFAYMYSQIVCTHAHVYP